jgi:molecular chaperone DnaK
VSAKDLGTSKEQKISITGSSGLTKEEVDKMQREAESHAEEDRKAKEAIELRNNADNLAYQCEKQLKDLGDKLDEARKKSDEDAVAKVREALKGNDNDAVKRVRSMTSRPNSKRSVRSSTRRPPRRLVPSAAPQKVPPLEPKARRRTQMS